MLSVSKNISAMHAWSLAIDKIINIMVSLLVLVIDMLFAQCCMPLIMSFIYINVINKLWLHATYLWKETKTYLQLNINQLINQLINQTTFNVEILKGRGTYREELTKKRFKALKKWANFKIFLRLYLYS